jgi:hypothetical protein
LASFCASCSGFYSWGDEAAEKPYVTALKIGAGLGPFAALRVTRKSKARTNSKDRRAIGAELDVIASRDITAKGAARRWGTGSYSQHKNNRQTTTTARSTTPH